MPKIIANEPKKNTGKRVLIGLVIVVVLAGLAFGGWYWWTHRSNGSTTKDTANQQTNVANAQSKGVQQASQSAQAQAKAGDPKAGAQSLGDAAAKADSQTDKAQLYSQQASLYSQAGENDQAVTAAKQAIAADPTNWNMYANLGFIYQSMGDKQNAIANFNQAITVMKQQGNTSGQSEMQGAINYLEGK